MNSEKLWARLIQKFSIGLVCVSSLLLTTNKANAQVGAGPGGGIFISPAVATTSGPNTFTGAQTIVVNGLTNVGGDGLTVTDNTPATVGIPVQMSPRIRLSGRVWDTDDAVSRTINFFTEVLPVSGTTVSGIYRLGYINPVSLATVFPFSITQDGTSNAAFLGTISAGSNITTPSFIRAGAVDSTAPSSGDLVANRGGTPGTGAIFFGGSANAHFIFYNGTNMAFTDPLVVTGSISASTSFQINGAVFLSSTAPTVTGFGVGAAIVNSNGTAAFTINVGTGGTAQTGTINLPGAATGWKVDCVDVINNALFVTSQTGGATGTATLQNYSRTTGLAIAWTASDVLRCSAVGY